MRLRDIRAIIAVLLLPLLCASMLLWSFSGRTSSINRVPAAIINQDTGTTIEINGKFQFVPFGRELIAELLKPQKDTFDWRIVQADRAVQGLRSGDFALVVTIPKDFSKRIATIGTTAANPAQVQVITNDADSTVVSLVSTSITDAAARALGKTVTESMLERIYLGFSQQKIGLGKAVDGAKQLTEGANKLSDGAIKANNGARQLVAGNQKYFNGVNKLIGGIGEAATGSEKLADGLTKGHKGALKFAAGMARFRDGFVGSTDKDGLLSGLRKLSDGVNGHPGHPGLAEGTAQLATGLNQLADKFNALEKQVSKVKDTLPDKAELDELANQIDALASTWKPVRERWIKAMAEQDNLKGVINFLHDCPAEATPQRCKQAEALATMLEQAQLSPANRELINNAIKHFDETLAKLIQNAPPEKLSEITRQFGGLKGQLFGDNSNPGLFNGIRQLAAGGQQISDGINGKPGQIGLRQGLDQLVAGGVQLQNALDGDEQQPGLINGAWQLAEGYEKASAGARKLSEGLRFAADQGGKLLSGADQLSAGTLKLADGLGALSNGANRLGNGIGKLASGLIEGAEMIPSYSDTERNQIIKMAVHPITTNSEHINPSSSASAAIFPLAATLSLWMGAFATFLLLPALRRRFLSQALNTTNVAWHSWYPAASISAVHALLIGVVAIIVGIKAVNPIFTAAILIIGALSFLTINQAMIALFGARSGRIISLAFLVVQAVSMAGLLPIQTAPETFRALHQLLPLAILASGLRESILDGHAFGVAGIIVPLVLWGTGSWLVVRAAVPNARREFARREEEYVANSDF